MTSFQRAQFVNRIIACVRPHISFPGTPAGAKPGQYVATFEVNLLPNGRQASRRLQKSSGLTAYDSAVERALLRCDPFPKPDTGDMPRTILLNFDPVDRQ
jgi:colicin import membrane protein